MIKFFFLLRLIIGCHFSLSFSLNFYIINMFVKCIKKAKNKIQSFEFVLKLFIIKFTQTLYKLLFNFTDN